MKIVSEANKTARKVIQDTHKVIRRDRRRIEAILKALRCAGIEAHHVSVDSSSYNVNITGTRADLTIMFGILRRLGLTPSRRPEEKTQYYATFWYWNGEGSGEFVFVSFSSTTCKRVQVGTKTEEVPVYEMVCEDN